MQAEIGSEQSMNREKITTWLAQARDLDFGMFRIVNQQFKMRFGVNKQPITKMIRFFR